MSKGVDWVLLARVLRPQGRRGEVLADLLTDFPERFGERPEVWLAAAGFTEGTASGGDEPQPSAVEGYWLPVGRNAGRIVLTLRGCESIEAASALAGREVVIPATERAPLEGDAVYVSELVGATVYDRGQALGVIREVEFATTADGLRRLDDAAPLLSVEAADGSEILIPFAKAYLVEVDLAARAVRMALPEGLVEINRVTGASAAGGDQKRKAKPVETIG